MLLLKIFLNFQKFLERVEIKPGAQSSYKYKRTFKPTGTGPSKPAARRVEEN